MPQEMIRVGLVGVTGYTGMELARLLTGHPNMKLTAATSRTEAGKRLGDLYPFLNGLPGADVILIEPEPELIAKNAIWPSSPSRTRRPPKWRRRLWSAASRWWIFPPDFPPQKRGNL